MPTAAETIRQFQALLQAAQETPPDTAEGIELLAAGTDLIATYGAVDLAYLLASEKQIRLAELFHSGSHRLIAAVGANRSGKSWFCARMCLAKWMMDDAQDKSVVWCISPTYRKSQLGAQRLLYESLPASGWSRKWSPELGFGAHAITTYRAAADRRITVVFLNEEQQANIFESDAVDIVWWDEASRESLLGRLRARIVDRAGRILISTLPEQLWLRFRIADSDNANWHHEQFTTYDNEANLPPGEIQSMWDDLTPEERQLRILGEYIALMGLVIPEYTPILAPEGNLVETRPIGDDWPVWIYCDVGLYTAALLLTVDEHGHAYVADEVYTMAKRADENSEQIRQMLARNDRTVDQVAGFYMDPAAWAYTAANRVTIGSQYQQAGLPFTGWSPVQKVGKKAMFNHIRKGFHNRRLSVFDRCHHLSHELSALRWKMDENQKIDLREQQEVGADHAIDCLKSWWITDPGFDQVYAPVDMPDELHGDSPYADELDETMSEPDWG